MLMISDEGLIPKCVYDQHCLPIKEEVVELFCKKTKLTLRYVGERNDIRETKESLIFLYFVIYIALVCFFFDISLWLDKKKPQDFEMKYIHISLFRCKIMKRQMKNQKDEIQHHFLLGLEI